MRYCCYCKSWGLYGIDDFGNLSDDGAYFSLEGKKFSSYDDVISYYKKINLPLECRNVFRVCGGGVPDHLRVLVKGRIVSNYTIITPNDWSCPYFEDRG